MVPAEQVVQAEQGLPVDTAEAGVAAAVAALIVVSTSHTLVHTSPIIHTGICTEMEAVAEAVKALVVTADQAVFQDGYILTVVTVADKTAVFNTAVTVATTAVVAAVVTAVLASVFLFMAAPAVMVVVIIMLAVMAATVQVIIIVTVVEQAVVQAHTVLMVLQDQTVLKVLKALQDHRVMLSQAIQISIT